jgi:hypothetical protein
MREHKPNTRPPPPHTHTHLLAHERPEALGVQPVLVHVVRVGAAVTTRARHTLRSRKPAAAAAAGSQQQQQQQAGSLSAVAESNSSTSMCACAVLLYLPLPCGRRGTVMYRWAERNYACEMCYSAAVTVCLGHVSSGSPFCRLGTAAARSCRRAGPSCALAPLGARRGSCSSSGSSSTNSHMKQVVGKQQQFNILGLTWVGTCGWVVTSWQAMQAADIHSRTGVRFFSHRCCCDHAGPAAMTRVSRAALL